MYLRKTFSTEEEAMIRSSSEAPYRAMLFAHIRLSETVEGSQATRLYAVEGKPGIFRRVALASKEEGSFRAWFDDGMIRLVRANDVEAEMVEAGYVKNGDADMPLFDGAGSKAGGDQETLGMTEPAA